MLGIYSKEITSVATMASFKIEKKPFKLNDYFCLFVVFFSVTSEFLLLAIISWIITKHKHVSAFLECSSIVLCFELFDQFQTNNIDNMFTIQTRCIYIWWINSFTNVEIFVFAEVRDTSKEKSEGYFMKLKWQGFFRQLYYSYSS